MGLGFSIAGGVARQVYFIQRVEEEKSRFNNSEVAKRYLKLYKPFNKILAELSIGKNAPRYHAAIESLRKEKETVRDGRSLTDYLFN